MLACTIFSTTSFLSLLLFTASTNFAETILSNQSPLSVLPHLFFFRFNFCSSFNTSSTGYDHHHRHQQQLLQHFARLQPNRTQPRAPQQNLNHSFDRFLLVSLHFISAVVATLSSTPQQLQHPSTYKQRAQLLSHSIETWFGISKSSVGSNKYRDVLPDYHNRGHSVLNTPTTV